jgi:hypothetical protein
MKSCLLTECRECGRKTPEVFKKQEEFQPTINRVSPGNRSFSCEWPPPSAFPSASLGSPQSHRMGGFMNGAGTLPSPFPPLTGRPVRIHCLFGFEVADADWRDLGAGQGRTGRAVENRRHGWNGSSSDQASSLPTWTEAWIFIRCIWNVRSRILEFKIGRIVREWRFFGRACAFATGVSRLHISEGRRRR